MAIRRVTVSRDDGVWVWPIAGLTGESHAMGKAH